MIQEACKSVDMKTLARKIQTALYRAGYNGGWVRVETDKIAIGTWRGDEGKSYDKADAERYLESLIEQMAS